MAGPHGPPPTPQKNPTALRNAIAQTGCSATAIPAGCWWDDVDSRVQLLASKVPYLAHDGY